MTARDNGKAERASVAFVVIVGFVVLSVMAGSLPSRISRTTSPDPEWGFDLMVVMFLAACTWLALAAFAAAWLWTVSKGNGAEGTAERSSPPSHIDEVA